MKRVSFFLAVLLLATSLLPSCGTKDTPAETAASATSAPAAAESTEPPEYVSPGIDYNGQTITIATYDFAAEMAYKIAQYNALMNEESGDIVSEALVRRNLQVAEELNISLEKLDLLTADRDKIEKLSNFILAGEDAFEFALAMESGMKNWLPRSELLTDLNTIKTLDLTHSWWNQKAAEEFTLNGRIFNAPGDLSFYRLGSPITVFYNKKVLEDNGLANPYELVRSGSWTLDRVIEMCTKVYRDVNGNGTVDIEPDVIGFLGEQSTTMYWYFGMGLRVTEKDTNGIPVTVLNSEKTVNYLEKWTPFFRDEKLAIYNDYSRYKSLYPSVFTDLFEPKLKNDTALFFTNQLLVAMDLRDMDTDFGILPVPKADEDQKEYIGYCNGAWNDMMIVPVTNSHTDRTGVVAEALGYYGQQYVLPAFINNTILSRDIRDEDSREMVDLIFASLTCDIGATFNWGSIVNVLYTVVGNNDASTFASAYASKESAIQSALQTTLETLKK